MKPILSFLFLFLLFQPTSFAQMKLEGVWQGTIIVGGLDSSMGYPMELYIQRNGKQITGRSYIHISNDITIEMELRGNLYEDLSLYFNEIKFINDESSTYVPPFLRKYELTWHRSIAGSSLNGYWQEIKNDVLGDSRERGRIYLKKLTQKKA